jgi:diaminopropionate ammonia-lyase
LIELPQVADELGVGRVFVKDESRRLGLPAFKVLGCSWAVHRLLAEREADAGALTLVTATDGNHGRALAWVARQFGALAHVFVPQGVHPAAVAAIAGEGARVTEVDGSYDSAVRAADAAVDGRPDAVLVQDTAWPGYERIPSWIVEGYSTLFAETDAQLVGSPDLVVVPVGVGSLAQAAVTHYRSRAAGQATALLSVEPHAAACVLESLIRRQPVSLETGETAMAGLNCGTPSHLAWPYLRDGLDAAVAVGDDDAATAARDLAALGVPAGPCGAASLAGVRAALTGPDAEERRAALRLGADATVVLLSTEGPAANPQFEEDRP